MKKINNVFIIYLVILQVLVFIRNIQAQDFQAFLYICNQIPILLAVFFYFNKINYIKALINLGFLVQIVWTFDLLIKLFFDIYLFGFTMYIFESNNVFYNITAILIHTTTLFPSLFFTYKIRIFICS